MLLQAPKLLGDKVGLVGLQRISGRTVSVNVNWNCVKVLGINEG